MSTVSLFGLHRGGGKFIEAAHREGVLPDHLILVDPKEENAHRLAEVVRRHGSTVEVKLGRGEHIIDAEPGDDSHVVVATDSAIANKAMVDLVAHRRSVEVQGVIRTADDHGASGRVLGVTTASRPDHEASLRQTRLLVDVIASVAPIEVSSSAFRGTQLEAQTTRQVRPMVGARTARTITREFTGDERIVAELFTPQEQYPLVVHRRASSDPVDEDEHATELAHGINLPTYAVALADPSERYIAFYAFTRPTPSARPIGFGWWVLDAKAPPTPSSGMPLTPHDRRVIEEIHAERRAQAGPSLAKLVELLARGAIGGATAIAASGRGQAFAFTD